MPYKLGKLSPKANPRTLSFHKYLSEGLFALPAPARKVYREYATPESARLMYGNDRWGDCTCAAIADLLILWSIHTGKMFVPTLDEVLAVYSGVTGFDPISGTNDNGAAMTDVLDYMRTTGMGGHKILAWAQIDHTDLLHRQLGVDLFGATYVGVQLPSSAQDQFQVNLPWEVVDDAEIDGGHAIIHPGYGSAGGDYVSWARWDQKASSAWEVQYIDEEYVLITEDWFNQVTQKTPGGLDLATLEQDLKALSA